MADLNPSIRDTELAVASKDRFSAALREAAPAVIDEATRQGDQYFFIPALERHRGVVHFYLEHYATDDRAADTDLARAVAEAAIDTHAAILESTVRTHGSADVEAWSSQLAYHTLYVFQVLTLDRGTTLGLLVHDENDVGILGSLPSHVDRGLLASWRSHLPAPAELLLDQLLEALPRGEVVLIDDDTKRALAAAVRSFYHAHPAALELQARGNVIPPTVANHR